jgi:hypothetical protein
MGKNGKMAVIFSVVEYYDKLMELSGVLKEDYGIEAEIKNIKNVIGDGPKAFRTFLKELDGKEVLFVCLNIDCGFKCDTDSLCFLKGYVDTPVIVLNTKNILNPIGFAAISIIRAFEKEKIAVAV